MKNTDSIAQKIRELYAITEELERLYPGRKFTIDGHLVGSIGEVLVSERYGLTLLPNSTQTHDGEAKDGRLVQIKATQTKRIAISSEPDFLIAIQIQENGTWLEIYNGPGRLVWENAGKLQKNGQRPISVAKLKSLMKTVLDSHRIQPIERE